MKKRITMFLAAVMAAMCATADPTVTDVVAKQRYPWNGLVDITCKVSGIDGSGNDHYFSVAAVMPDSGDARRVSRFWVVQNGANTTDRAVRTNGSYRLLWDATADIGQMACDNMVIRVIVKTHNKVQLWEGGPYWADTNIGAEEPYEHGYYFWWGDTVGYKRENDKWVKSDGSSSNCSFTSSWAIRYPPTYLKGITTLKSDGWITAGEILTPEHDAAHMHWGGKWRMPTMRELSNLSSKCTWSKTTINGVNGYRVSGKGDYASDSIFLPCAGYGNMTSLYQKGVSGYYWSSVPYSDELHSYYLYFDFFTSSTYAPYYITYDYYRYYGQAVRPVQGFTE